MMQTIRAFLEFCYIARQEVINTQSLNALEEALLHFHHYVVIFEECGVCTNGINLPRQHFLVHYPALIRVFSSPNGLCSLITKSKHIKAVKQPWWCSSHYKALGQMLLTNQHLDKIAACHADFTSHGMLDDTSISGNNSYKLSYKMLITFLLIKMMMMTMEETLLDHPYLLK